MTQYTSAQTTQYTNSVSKKLVVSNRQTPKYSNARRPSKELVVVRKYREYFSNENYSFCIVTSKRKHSDCVYIYIYIFFFLEIYIFPLPYPNYPRLPQTTPNYPTLPVPKHNYITVTGKSHKSSKSRFSLLYNSLALYCHSLTDNCSIKFEYA